ncbi:MAG: aminopeptidase family protein P [Eubacteriales bacterium]|nr:aminopeptidase family protein P [Eubacteriales bacterium]
MKKEIVQLQQLMEERGIDVYFVPSSDDHNSEYFADHFKCCEFLTGFRSESAELVLTWDSAKLWTDGRYFLQAEKELAGTGVELMKMGEPGVPTVQQYLTDLVYNSQYFNPMTGKKGYVLGFDGSVVSSAREHSFRSALSPLGVTLRTGYDLVGEVWSSRPKDVPTHIHRLPLISSGKPASQKLVDVIHAMTEDGATHLLLSDLSEIAWITNLRASDILYTPVFYSFLLISLEQAELFVKDGALPKNPDGTLRIPSDYIDGWHPKQEIKTLTPAALQAALKNRPKPEDPMTPFQIARKELAEAKARRAEAEFEAPDRRHDGGESAYGVPVHTANRPKKEERPTDPEDLSFLTIRNYSEIEDALASLPEGSVIWYDPETTPAKVAEAIPDSASSIRRETPVRIRKCIKNKIEIQSTLEAHIRDGRAMVEFIHWLKTWRDTTAKLRNAPKLTEMDAAEKLNSIRLKQPGCFDLSFETIAGYGPNGAIIHYAPSREHDAVLRPEGFLLVDSGGQYLQGTTDITRTIALGRLTPKMKEYYTYVLKSHIALANAVITPDTTGSGLDTLARRPLRDHDLDFNHGISHGVGHVLSVHEGPNGIRRSARELRIGPGMIQSDEPGVYIAGEFGIRIENEIICTENEDGNYCFIPITYCPYEREAILPELLSDEEIDWINSYHQAVYDVLSPRIDDSLRGFLKEETAPIER